MRSDATQHDIEHRELSPFQSHSIIKKRGEIIVELQCQRVTVQAVLGERREDKCSKDALLVYLNREPVYLASNTRHINDKLDVEFDDCDRFFPPVFRAEEGGGLLMANPGVTLANLTVIDMTAHVVFYMSIRYVKVTVSCALDSHGNFFGRGW